MAKVVPKSSGSKKLVSRLKLKAGRVKKVLQDYTKEVHELSALVDNRNKLFLANGSLQEGAKTESGLASLYDYNRVLQFNFRRIFRDDKRLARIEGDGFFSTDILGEDLKKIEAYLVEEKHRLDVEMAEYKNNVGSAANLLKSGLVTQEQYDSILTRSNTVNETIKRTELLLKFKEYIVYIIRGTNTHIQELRKSLEKQSTHSESARLLVKSSHAKDKSTDEQVRAAIKIIDEEETQMRELCGEMNTLLGKYRDLLTWAAQQEPGSVEQREISFVDSDTFHVVLRIIATYEEYLKKILDLEDTMSNADEEKHIANSMFVGYAEKDFDLSDANAHLSSQGAILASAGEVVRFKLETNNGYTFLSRTACLYFKENGRMMMAFCDATTPENNILLSHTAHKEYGQGKNKKSCSEDWVVSNSDEKYTIIEKMIIDAKKKGRCLPLEKTHDIPVSTISSNTTVLAMLGKVGAASYQEYCKSKEWSEVRLWFDDSSIEDSKVRVRLLAVCYYLVNIYLNACVASTTGAASGWPGAKNSCTGNEGYCCNHEITSQTS